MESRALAQDSLSNSQLSSVPVKPRLKKKVPTVEDAYNADVIEQSFQVSIKMLPLNIRSLVMERQKFIEDKVYLEWVDNSNNVLERLYQNIDGETHFKDQIKENLNDLMADIQAKF